MKNDEELWYIQHTAIGMYLTGFDIVNGKEVPCFSATNRLMTPDLFEAVHWGDKLVVADYQRNEFRIERFRSLFERGLVQL